MVTFKFLKIIHPSFAKSEVKLLPGLSVLSEPKILEENVLWCFYTPVGLRDCCPTMHIILFLPALSSEWCLMHTVSKSHHIYNMHRKGCSKQKKTVCGGFGVCFQSKNNEFQKRGRRSRGSHRAKPRKGREKGKRAASSELVFLVSDQ